MSEVKHEVLLQAKGIYKNFETSKKDQAFLMDAIPQADPHRRNQHRRVLMGEVPSPVNLPSGCCFHTRCPYATERCRTEVPELRECDGRMVACHRAGENWD